MDDLFFSFNQSVGYFFLICLSSGSGLHFSSWLWFLLSERASIIGCFVVCEELALIIGGIFQIMSVLVS